jgi:hypothetical protein
MVNLPPDPNDFPPASNPPPPDARRPLSFDEMVALVVAFVGIGTILWWGMTRSTTLADQVGQLQRRVTAAPAPLAPETDPAEGLFVPRTLDSPPRRSPGVTPDQQRGLPQFGMGRATRRDRSTTVVPVPVDPTPAEPTPPATRTAPANGTAPAALDQTDVPDDHWAYPFMASMYAAGYLPDFNGGQLEPDRPLSRADLALLLNQAFGDGSAPPGADFTDVAVNHQAAAAIDQAVAQGFMSGYPEGDFRPDQPVPRYEVLVSLASGLNLSPSPSPEQTLQAFPDANALPEWSLPLVAATAENGLIVNYPNRDQLRPTATATRAEVMAMIHQVLVDQGELPPVESNYAVPAL